MHGAFPRRTPNCCAGRYDGPPVDGKIRRSIFLVLAFVVMDVLGYSIVLPLVPHYAAVFGATPSQVGWAMAINALSQLVGSPVVGAMSDAYGRRTLLLACALATSASFGMLACAGSFFMVVLSRLLDGLLGGNASLAKAYIADVSPDDKVGTYFGAIGAAYAVGFTLGPALGGVMAEVHLALPAGVACFLSVANVLGIWWWLEESLPPDQRARDVRPERVLADSLRPLVGASRPGPLRQAMALRSAHHLVFCIYNATVTLHHKAALGLSAGLSGCIVAISAIAFGLAQGTLSWLRRRSGPRFDHASIEARIKLSSFALLAVSCVGWSLSGDPATYVAWTVMLSAASGALSPVTDSDIAKVAPKGSLGATMGTSAMLGCINRVVASLLGTSLFQYVGPWAPGLAAFPFALGGTAYLWLRCRAPRKADDAEDAEARASFCVQAH